MEQETDPLFGPAATSLQILRVKSKRLLADERALKVLLHGPCGVGKTEVAQRFAREFAGEPSNVKSLVGNELTVDFVHEWKGTIEARPPVGTGFVLILNQCDAMNEKEKALLVSVLDEMPAHCAFIGTSASDFVANVKLSAARLVTRLECIEVGRPVAEEISRCLRERLPGLPLQIAETIAANCDGCVRSAIIDAENFLDTQTALAQIAASNSVSVTETERKGL